MPRISRQTIAPYPFNTKTLSESNWRAVVLKMSSSVNVLRYLTSKIVYTSEEITDVEVYTLFCAFDDVVRKIETDRGLARLLGTDVFTFRSVYQELDYLKKLSPKLRRRTLMEKFSFYRGKFFSERYYRSVEGQARRLYETLIKHRHPKTFPAKTFVGKGYGDHGTAKNKAIDGSQSWQEVASDVEFQETHLGTERNPEYFRSFIVHPLQLVGGGKQVREI